MDVVGPGEWTFLEVEGEAFVAAVVFVVVLGLLQQLGFGEDLLHVSFAVGHQPQVEAYDRV